MKTQTKILRISAIAILIVFTVLLNSSYVSALIINSVETSKLTPGGESTITIEIKNTLDENVEDVSLSLIFDKIPFSSIGSSEDSIDKIKDDDTEEFSFRIKASNDIKPGDYNIPYVLSYKYKDVQQTPEQGTIGVTVKGNPELTYSVNAETPIIGQKGKLTLKIINKGFGDAKFVSVKVSSVFGFNLLSEDSVYMGNIASDDFETVSFDVSYTKENPLLDVSIEYKDFDNKKITQQISLPFKVYTKNEALKLGIINKNYTIYYAVIIIVLIIVWLVWRRIQKVRRLKKANQRKE